jgi:hypothetical protein
VVDLEPCDSLLEVFLDCLLEPLWLVLGLLEDDILEIASMVSFG